MEIEDRAPNFSFLLLKNVQIPDGPCWAIELQDLEVESASLAIYFLMSLYH